MKGLGCSDIYQMSVKRVREGRLMRCSEPAELFQAGSFCGVLWHVRDSRRSLRFCR